MIALPPDQQPEALQMQYESPCPLHDARRRRETRRRLVVAALFAASIAICAAIFAFRDQLPVGW